MLSPIRPATAGVLLLSETDRLVRADASAGLVQLVLPDCTGKPDLNIFIKEVADGTDGISVSADGGGLLDGLSTFDMIAPRQGAWFCGQADGTYDVIAGNNGGVTIGRDVESSELASDESIGTSLQDVAGVTPITLVLDVAGKVKFGVTGRFSSSVLFGASLSFKINSTDYSVAGANYINASGSDATTEDTLSGDRTIFLAAGTYTITMRASSVLNPSNLLAGAALDIDFPTRTVSGGSSSDPAMNGDVTGVASASIVQGIQGDLLPTPVASKFTKRDAANTAWELVGYGSAGNTVCEGNDSRLSDDRDPNAHATSHQHGGGDEIATATPAANAIPKAGASGRIDIGFVASGTPDGTMFVRDDGTLAVPPGMSTSDPMDLAFFSGLSLLPGTTVKNLTGGGFPAPDVQNTTGMTFTRKNDQASFVSGGTVQANYTWDAGSLYSKMLVIVCGIRSRQYNFGPWASSTLPATAIGKNGYCFSVDNFSNRFALLEMDNSGSGVVVNTGGGGTIDPGNSYLSPSWDMAIYCAANIQKCFLRPPGGKWITHIETTDATVTQFRYGGIWVQANGAVTMYCTLPLGIFVA